ncbi:uncharacterized protein L969DRAFT_48744 [Mixia osmundae IAM 14324]|uniref:Uncharacterized protein n=1 Tax=Mixia osmundae (strain CBS 9802 / IAM 14324 / JCM 22182 / KY 12970) TaxID=764103 RepID=G7E0X3_MIXOS|nr:uncharacterized protein L969DRAFT_48744 [Mixia osmundae IAM 14324]KEI39512.1 hypothetical protein L969DRAFT_48744 [Mixia osmundae IAM 14324]GAA96483.1 hypothetical protein E5Q_03151 [Mixia osmundae IAM 14324]
MNINWEGNAYVSANIPTDNIGFSPATVRMLDYDVLTSGWAVHSPNLNVIVSIWYRLSTSHVTVDFGLDGSTYNIYRGTTYPASSCSMSCSNNADGSYAVPIQAYDPEHPWP